MAAFARGHLCQHCARARPPLRLGAVRILPAAQHVRGHGSRWDLDPLWSTEATTINHDAAELGKLGRAAIVSTDPIAMRHLKVCWAVDGPGNCGRCEKCLRTMTCLQIAGALDRTDRFDTPLTIEAIMGLRADRATAPAWWASSSTTCRTSTPTCATPGGTQARPVALGRARAAPPAPAAAAAPGAAAGRPPATTRGALDVQQNSTNTRA